MEASIMNFSSASLMQCEVFDHRMCTSTSDRSGKDCCGQWFNGPPLRFLVALGGVACTLGGATLGSIALAGSPTSHLTAGLLMTALTICSPLVSRSNLSNIKEFLNFYHTHNETAPKLSLSEQNYLPIKSEICNVVEHEKFAKAISNRTDFDFIKILEKSAPTANEMFSYCYRMGTKLFDCERLTNRVLTDYGMCHSVNMQNYSAIFREEEIGSAFDSFKQFNPYNSDDNFWSLTKGYSDPDESDKIPYRSTRSYGFEFVMSLNESDQSDLCARMRANYIMLINMPNEIPSFITDLNFMTIGTETRIQLSAIVHTTDESLRKYSYLKRGCFFEGERKLQFFKTYTKEMCMLECLSNFTIRRCGCSKFSFLHSKTTRICQINETQCHIIAFKDWPIKDEMSNHSDTPCDCYPPCTDIIYKIKSNIQYALNENTSVTVAKLKEQGRKGELYTSLVIKFFDFQVQVKEKFATYELQNVIADCGGLLGLFLGFSFTSVINFICRRFMTSKEKTFKDSESLNLDEGENNHVIVVKEKFKAPRSLIQQ